MTREEARRYMIQWQQKLKDGGFPIDSDRIQSLRVAIEALKDRPKGEWVSLAECSVCGKQADDFIDGYVDGLEYLPNYCPNCGARMKGGAE